MTKSSNNKCVIRHCRKMCEGITCLCKEHLEAFENNNKGTLIKND